MPRLTPAMHKALDHARRAGPTGLRRVHDNKPGRPEWPAHPATLTALLRRGHIEHRRLKNRNDWPVDQWTITDTGRLALNPPTRPKPDRPRFLQSEVWRGGDTTNEPSRSIDYEPGLGAVEYVDPAQLDPSHTRLTRTRHEGAQDATTRARELRALRRAS